MGRLERKLRALAADGGTCVSTATAVKSLFLKFVETQLILRRADVPKQLQATVRSCPWGILVTA